MNQFQWLHTDTFDIRKQKTKKDIDYLEMYVESDILILPDSSLMKIKTHMMNKGLICQKFFLNDMERVNFMTDKLENLKA